MVVTFKEEIWIDGIETIPKTMCFSDDFIRMVWGNEMEFIYCKIGLSGEVVSWN